MRPTGFPSLHVPFDRLLVHTNAPAWTVTVAPEGPDVTTIQAMGWDSVVGGGERLMSQLANLSHQGYRIVVARGRRGLESAHRATARRARTEARTFVAPLERGFILPAIKLAVLAEPDLTGRRRAHRPVRARRRTDAERFFDDLNPGDYVVHHQHGVARFAGMVKRSISGVERDYLLLEYRGDDKLYVPSDQIDTVRHYTGGEQPSLSRLNGGDWSKTKARVRAEVTQIAQELVVLYQKRLHTPGHAFAPDTPWQHELEDAFPYQETPDQLKAIVDVKADMEGATADGPPRVRRRRLRQDRGRHPSRLQGGAGRQAGGRARADDAARPATQPDVRRALCRVPAAGRSRCRAS